MPSLPVGWNLAFPKKCCQNFTISAMDSAPFIDYTITTVTGAFLSNKIKLQPVAIQWFEYKTKPTWVFPENIGISNSEEFLIIKRIRNSDFISTYTCDVLDYKQEFVQSDEFDSTSLNNNVPIFLFTDSSTFSLDLDLGTHNRCVSYSNIETNVNVLKSICEATYLQLSKQYFSRYNPDLYLEYTDHSIFYRDKHTKFEFLEYQGTVANILPFLELFLSFPSKFASILLPDTNAVLHLDSKNPNNFLYKIPRNINKFSFLHNAMPLMINDIRPPFLLQMKNSYNACNIEINEKQVSCLAVLSEKANTNVLEFLETFETNFSPFPNQYLQFVITDNKNNIIFLHPNSLIMLSILSNNDD